MDRFDSDREQLNLEIKRARRKLNAESGKKVDKRDAKLISKLRKELNALKTQRDSLFPDHQRRAIVSPDSLPRLVLPVESEKGIKYTGTMPAYVSRGHVKNRVGGATVNGLLRPWQGGGISPR